MDKKRIFIHAGTHKTGTTAIQRFLKGNREAFGRRGFGIAGLSSAERKHLKEIAKEIGSGSHASIDPKGDPIKESLTRCQKASSRSLHSYIVSWEGFSGNDSNGYLDAINYAKLLSLHSNQYSLKVITYFRRQDEFIESIYTQRVKQGYGETFGHYLKSIPNGGFDWHAWTNSYEKELGRENVIVARYGKSYLPSPDAILREFIKYLGLKPNGFDFSANKKRQKVSNPGWPREVVELTRELNAFIPKEQRSDYIRAIGTLIYKNPEDPYTFFSNQQRDELMNRFRLSNRQLAVERFGETNKELFEEEDLSRAMAIDSLASECDSYTSLSRDDLLQLILRIINNFAAYSSNAGNDQIPQHFVEKGLRRIFKPWLRL